MKTWGISGPAGIILLASIALSLTPAICNSQEWSRNGKGDYYLLGYSMDKATTTGSVGGTRVSLEFDKMGAGGFGVGYSVNDHLNFNLEWFIGAANIKGRTGKVAIEGDTTFFSPYVNVEINILKYRLTPFITGGVGYIRFDGDFQGTPFSEEDFSYNAGAGLRWDVTNHFLIKALYRGTWTNLKDSDKSILFKGPEVVIGLMF